MADLRISTRNSRFQLLEALTRNRNHRSREHRFVVQGVRPISQAIEHGWTILTVIHDAQRTLSPWARDALQQAQETIAMSPALLAELADKDEGATEIIAVVAMPPDDLSRIPVPRDFLGMVFDRPTQPGNIGSILRSMDALGGHGLIVSGHAADPYDPKSVRASTGSLFATPVVRAASGGPVFDWVRDVRAQGTPLTLVATDEHGDVDVWDYDFAQPSLVLIGNETTGLARGWREAADVIVRVPMSGSASSLNASNAATLMLYEAARQRATGSTPRQGASS
ncbi:TrmH family RNA methyltransferase [Microbacterium sp. 2MCAF23]|uniref:TrmH family RNA methyltransferase n=1 Tax=Microbacterium sp. 2MCAF23 TaxID=3232985 RepID=UPI003F98D47B